MPASGNSKKRILTASAIAVAICLFGFIIFQLKKKHRRPTNASASSPALSATFKKKHFQTGTLLFSQSNDLENENGGSISMEKAASGLKSSQLSMTTEYGFPVAKKIKDIPAYESLRSVQLNFKCFMRNDMVSAQYLLTIDDKDGKNVFQQSKQIVCQKKYDWNDLQYTFPIDPKFLDPENTIKLYAWNKELREFYIDDITVSFFADDHPDVNPEFTSNFFYDFEKPDSTLLSQSKYIKEGTAHSGKMAFDLSNTDEYGPIVTKQLGDVCLQPAKRVNTSIWVYPIEENASIDMVVSLFNPAGEKYFLQSKRIDAKLLPKDTWTKVNATIVLPADGTSPDDVIQVLARSLSKTKLLFDDFEIVYDDAAEPRGNVSDIDPKTFYTKAYTPQRNKPPFETMYLQKQEIGNENSAFLINSGNIKLGDFTPGDDFLTGNFIADNHHLDQVVDIKVNEIGLYGYCADKKQFTQLWKSTNENDLQLFGNANEKIISDFDNNQSDDVLLINKKAKTAQLASFTAGNNCTANTHITIEDKKENPFESWNMSTDDIFMRGDFNGDKKTELLIVNSKSGEWSLQQYSAAKSWKALAANSANNKLDPAYFNDKTSKQIAGRFYANKNNAVIFCALTVNEKTTYMQLEFNVSRKQFDQKIIPAGDTDELFFKNKNTTLVGNFDTDAEQEFINLNTDWRFDLKYINVDAAGFNIAGNVDFKGYPADHNPKYYEFVKIISGHFITDQKTALIVMMRNCADKNFSGTACNQYEDLNYLPNSTQLYQFEK